MTGTSNISGHNLDVLERVFGGEKVPFVQDRKKSLFEHLTIGVERYSLASTGCSGDFGQCMFRCAVCQGVDFLISRNSDVAKAV